MGALEMAVLLCLLLGSVQLGSEPVGDAVRGEGGSYLVTNPGLAQSLFITGIYDRPITKTQA